MIKKIYEKYSEIILYLIVGGTTTVLSWILYAAFFKLFAQTFTSQTNVTISNILSWCGAFIFAFFTNKLFVFKSKSWELRIWKNELLKFFTARAITGVLDIVLVPFLVYIGFDYAFFNIDGFLAKILVTIIVVILNYVFSKLFVFKKEVCHE